MFINYNFYNFAISFLAITYLPTSIDAIIFDPVSSLHIWITISSLVNKSPNDNKALLFRQVELNWINAPLDDESEYMGLYLDGEPDEDVLPVSVHPLNGESSGQIITDFYLPQIPLLPNNSHDRNNEVPSIFSYGSMNKIEQEGILDSYSLQDECVGYCVAYFSRGRIIARNCLKTNPNWMKDSYQYIAGRSLPSLMIPGTHNSATYSSKPLDKNVLLTLFNKYELNQDENIFNQLVYGIRFLDLRVGYKQVKSHNEQLWIYHDIFRTEITVREVLEQVKRFLDMTSHEIIIMDFHRFTVGFQNENLETQRFHHAKLIDMIYKYLGNYIIPSYLGLSGPISEYVGQGKRLVVSYANKASLVGPESQQIGLLKASGSGEDSGKSSVVRDIDAIKQDEDDALTNKTLSVTKPNNNNNNNNELPQQMSENQTKEVGLLKKINKSFKILISQSRRHLSSNSTRQHQHQQHPQQSLKMILDSENDVDVSRMAAYNGNVLVAQTINKAMLFFSSVRHLWPNRDTIDGLQQYMNETTCRKYFGELSSMMIQLTPTVFGAISDKYDGNRRLAQQSNRLANDWIRNRWLHCINIVASDYFLGNDLIRLSIYANKLRQSYKNTFDLNSYGQYGCKAFKRVGGLLDKSKIPMQYLHHQPDQMDDSNDVFRNTHYHHHHQRSSTGQQQQQIIRHRTSDGNEIYLRPLVSSASSGLKSPKGAAAARDSFVDNVADGFSNLYSSFKRLFTS